MTKWWERWNQSSANASSSHCRKFAAAEDEIQSALREQIIDAICRSAGERGDATVAFRLTCVTVHRPARRGTTVLRCARCAKPESSLLSTEDGCGQTIPRVTVRR